METMFSALLIGAYFKCAGDPRYLWKVSETHALVFRGYVGGVAVFEPAGTPANEPVAIEPDRRIVRCDSPPAWMSTRMLARAAR